VTVLFFDPPRSPPISKPPSRSWASRRGEFRVDLWGNGTMSVMAKVTRYRYDEVVTWCAHEDFGLLDAKGRKVGIGIYMTRHTCQGVEAEFEAIRHCRRPGHRRRPQHHAQSFPRVVDEAKA